MIKKRKLLALVALTFHSVSTYTIPESLYGRAEPAQSNFASASQTVLNFAAVGVGVRFGEQKIPWRGWIYWAKSVLGLNEGWKTKKPEEWSEKEFINFLEHKVPYDLNALEEKEQIKLAAERLDLYAFEPYHNFICDLPIYKKIRSELIHYLYRVVSKESWNPSYEYQSGDPNFYPVERPLLSEREEEGIRRFLDKYGIKLWCEVPGAAPSGLISTKIGSSPGSTDGASVFPWVDCSQAQSVPATPPRSASTELKNQIDTLRTQEKEYATIFSDDQEYADRVAKRDAALKQSKAHEIYLQVYFLGDIQDVIPYANFDQCEKLDGTPIQHVLHAEFLDVMRNLKSHKSHDQLFYDFLRESLLVGIECNQKQNILQACGIADWCWSLWKCYRAMSEGVKQGVSNTVHSCMHPLQAIKGLVPAVKEAGYALYWLLEKQLRFETMMDLGDWEGAQRDAEPIRDFWRTVYQEVSKKSIADGVEGAAALATETILMGKLFGVLASSLGKACTTIKECDGLWGAASAITPEGTLVEIAAQAEMLFIESNEFRTAAEKLGRVVGPASSRCLEHSYVDLEKKFLEMIEPLQETLEKKFGIRITGIDFEHCFEGNWKIKTKRVTGGHASCNHPERLGKIEKIHPNGVIESRWHINGKSKPTTLFPKDWNEEMICKMLAESLKDISVDVTKKSGGLNFIGKLENMEIVFFIDSEGLITTFYPRKLGKTI